MTRIGSLFSGAGGLDLAVEAVTSGTTVWHCEMDPAASKVLAARWPGVPNLGDITRVDWSAVEPVDVLCGGFPCQDVSAAGRRAGLADGTRSGLWARFADAIDALQPSLVVAENVRGLLSARAHRAMESADPAMGDEAGRPLLRAAGAVLGDLADLGYDAQWCTVAAADIGAPHRRERVFIVAHPADAARDRWDQGRPESARIVGRPDVAVGGGEPVTLLPTPVVTDAVGARNNTSGRQPGSKHHAGDTLGDVIHRGDLLPTPSVADGDGGHATTRSGSRSDELLLPGVARAYAGGDLLPTPRTRDGKGASASRAGDNKHDLPSALLPTPEAKNAHAGPDYARMNRDGSGGHDLVTAVAYHQVEASRWGRYAPAIERWEQLTRPAPPPTEPNTKGNPRLHAPFAEWMQSWPAGWCTAPELGLTRNEQLRIIGNGVVPQQACYAVGLLLDLVEVAA